MIQWLEELMDKDYYCKSYVYKTLTTRIKTLTFKDKFKSIY